MTRIGHQQLTRANRTGTITYDRTIEYLVMYNNNPVPLYVRLGSPELPTQRNYDIAVPPNYIMGISVDSNQFGFRLGDDNVTLALISGVTVIEGLIDEPPPALGGVPIQGASLATSDLNNGFQGYVGPSSVILNLSLWGGLLVTLIPDATSGQAVLQIDYSSDGGTFYGYTTYAVWRSIPITVLIPKIQTFVRVFINSTTIVGEPAISGKISIRGTLAELTQSSYNPQTNSIVKTWAIAPSGSQQFTFVSVGLPAVSIAAIATAGSGAFPVIQLLVEASSDNINWRQVTTRRQFMSTGITLYRSFGNLDLFIRISIFELGGGYASNGSLYMSIPSAPDEAGILNTIYQTLGDINNPNQIGAYDDAYHELDGIRVSLGSVNTTLTTLHTDLVTINTSLGTVNTNLGTLHTDLLAINTSLGTVNTNLSTLHSDLVAVNNNLGTIHGDLTTTNASLNNISLQLNTVIGDLVTINTSVGAVNTSLATVNTHLTNIETYTQAPYQRGSTSSVVAADLTVCGAVAWTRGGAIFNPSSYILELDLFVQFNVFVAAQANITVDIGTAGAQVTFLALGMTANSDLAGAKLTPFQARFRFDGTRTGGILIPANNFYVWYNMSVAGTVVSTWILG